MPPNPTQMASPPKVRLTFRVGIVGHRPDRLRREDVPSLEKRLASALASVKKIVEDFHEAHPNLFTETPVSLRAISPLAEGTDRLFARQALKLGYSLCCPLPFHKAEFENDFKPGKSLEPDKDSIAEFNTILKEAQKTTGLVTFELDGSREDAAQAYAAAGKVVLNQSDLLIVVWDGEEGNKPGGTYETFQEALASGVSVLWMDARSPHPSQLLLAKKDLPPCSGRCVPHGSGEPDLAPVINAILEPPPGDAAPSTHGAHASGPNLRRAYFAESWPTPIRPFIWKTFRNLVRWPGKSGVSEASGQSPTDWPGADSKVAAWSNDRLSAHYTWADQLADRYGDKYRSAFITAYFLGALAVLLALIPHSFHGERLGHVERVCSFLELLVVLYIIRLVWRGNRLHWHDRWMAYRLLAELIRQLRFVAPLGGARPFPRPVSSLAHRGNPANSWMYWHLRSIDREAGLPEAKVTDEYLRICLQHVAATLDEQIAFHQTTAETCGSIDRRLHKSGFWLFVLTSVLIAIHFLAQLFPPLSNALETWELTFFCAWLPAVGAAIAGINHQGEFARTARRSLAMVEQLKQIRAELEPSLASSSKVRSPEAAAAALLAAQIMVDEVLDWRVVFLDRPLVATS
jgi:hypothetical protein